MLRFLDGKLYSNDSKTCGGQKREAQILFTCARNKYDVSFIITLKMYDAF